MVSNECMEPSHTLNAFGQTGSLEPSALLILDTNVVMGFGPVVTNEHPCHASLPFASQQSV